MIPRIVPPLTDLTVLVTRPAEQGASLCAAIAANGGTALSLPAIEIERLAAAPTGGHDLVIFLSVNAVAHGAALVTKAAHTRIAAIGKATAAALAAAGLPVDVVPATGFDSEALLAHPDLGLSAGSRVLLVRGSGGRELLHESFTRLGMQVETLEVYRRVRPQPDAALLAAIDAAWYDPGIDAVTITSVETWQNLCALLSERSLACLKQTTLVVPSRRIVEAASGAGHCGQAIVATGADDTSIISALARWHTRARTD